MNRIASLKASIVDPLSCRVFQKLTTIHPIRQAFQAPERIRPLLNLLDKDTHSIWLWFATGLFIPAAERATAGGESNQVHVGSSVCVDSQVSWMQLISSG